MSVMLLKVLAGFSPTKVKRIQHESLALLPGENYKSNSYKQIIAHFPTVNHVSVSFMSVIRTVKDKLHDRVNSGQGSY